MLIQKFKLETTKAFYGIDEVGRGSLIGPVITCCVYFNPSINFLIEPPTIIYDSKKMSSANRKKIIDWLKSEPSISYTIGSASIEEIDELNIRNANNVAMNRAFHSLYNSNKSSSLNTEEPETICYVDGNYFLPINQYKNIKFETIIKGDSKNIAIALASIIAKEYRDKLIQSISYNNPYGWYKNVGYGTKEHMNAILKHGISIHHRLSFIKKLCGLPPNK